jgi:hypothetical protein
MMKTSIRSKLLALLLIPVAVISIGVAFISYVQIRNTVEPIIFNLSQEIANQAAQVVDQWLIGLIKEVRAQAETERDSHHGLGKPRSKKTSQAA